VTDSAATSRKMVLVSVILLAVIAVVRKAQGTEDGSVFKRLWGIGVIGVILSVTADFAPSIAGPFAVLTLLGSLTNGGDKVIQGVLASVSDKIPAPSGHAPAGPTGPITSTAPATATAPSHTP
jgi:hypothetical protein